MKKIVPKKALTLRQPESSVKLAAVDGESRKFSMVVNSGQVIPNHWYWGNFAIDLNGVQIARQDQPALREHDSGRIVGYTESIRVDPKLGLVADGTFVDTEDGKEVLRLADQGFPWQASMYIPPSSVEEIAAGATAMVNGLTLTGPGAIFRQSRLREVSFCALGADENTSAVALSDGDSVEIDVKECDMDYSKLTADEIKQHRPELADAFKAEGKAEADNALSAALSAAKEEATKSERERVSAIAKQAQSFGLSQLGEKLVADGMDAATALSALKDAKIEQLSKSAPPSPGPSGDPAGEKLADGEEQWKAEFSKNADLRKEFMNSESAYLAFKRAETSGWARVLSR